MIIHYVIRVLYTVYADFKSCIVPQTRKNVVHHVPDSFRYLILEWSGNAAMEPVLDRGKSVIDTYLQTLLYDVARLYRRYNKPIIMLHSD